MMPARVLALVMLASGCAHKDPEPLGCEAAEGCEAPAPPPECQRNDDCGPAAKGPICDRGSGTCRACAAHSECASGVCRDDESIAAPVALGRCVPEAMVAIVDGGRCAPGQADGSAQRPYCEVQEAVAARFSFISVKPRERSTPYKAITVSGGSVAIFGPRRDADPQAVLGGVTVGGASTQLLLSDLAIQQEGGTAVACSEAELQLFRAIVAYSRDGVSSTAGCRLRIDRSRLAQNARAALRTATTARHRVTNTLFVQNGRGFDAADRLNQSDIVIDLGSNQSGNVFSFNTVSGNEGFVSCRGGQSLRNSILAGKRAPLRDQSCVLQQVYVGDEETPRLDRQFALTRDSQCCVDSAQADATVSVDYDGSPRPQGLGYDMGCYELR